MRWLFWESSFDELEVERDATYVLARVLEHGRLEEVRWAFAAYGIERIRSFFEDVGHPDLSSRTLAFWRAFFHAQNEPWKSPPSWRSNSSIPWPG
jgi:hypothetical protein